VSIVDRYNRLMKVNFYATLRPIVGQKTIEFDLDENVTVNEMVEIVVTRFPPLRRELLDEQGGLLPHVHVFVNGRDAPYLDNAMETLLKPGDKVDVFPSVAGGQESSCTKRAGYA
jgi:molybdopterin synthase sulfur carrier subunit